MRNDLLLALRTQRGWTQEELSERSGISVRTIRNLERGRIQSPRRSSLDLLFSVLDPELRGRGEEQAARPRGASGSAGPASPAGAAGTGSGTGSGTPGGSWARWRGPRPPRTVLVGREGDLERLTELVAGNPVTVLTGPGGVGKTRLALAVAERVAGAARGTVGVVQLGRIAAGPPGDGAAALANARHAVAEVLGEDHRPSVPGPGRALLVLDTTEHLPQATALLVEHLRGSCPDLRLILTTRRPPVLPEARIWETAPLPPDAAAELMNRRLASSALDHDLTGAPDLVRALCRELDGVPRLIEFAAHRLRTVPVTTLLSPEHLLELLGIPDFSVQPHQRSLRGSLDWSWAMLTQRQRQFMVRLAAAPDCVASDGQELAAWEPEFTRTEALCLLAELADASFLQVRRGPRYEYRMLRHVRAFVRHHHLRAAPQAPAQVRRVTAGA